MKQIGSKRHSVVDSSSARSLSRLCSPSWALLAALVAAAAPGTGCGAPAESPSTDTAGYDASGRSADAGTASDALPPEASTSETATCIPKQGPDDPDDDFADTNCDGIDGDKARAIFVAPSGNDDDAGTIQAPVKTLNRAVALATVSKKDVYACIGTYAESVNLNPDAVHLYGGYDCTAGWTRTTQKTDVAAPEGSALVIRGVAGDVVIDRFSFRSSDAVTPGDSSIAGFIVDSPQVKLSHVDFKAGAGADGKPGAPATSNPAPPPKGVDGQSLAPILCSCAYATPGCPANAMGGMSYASVCEVGGSGGTATKAGSVGGHNVQGGAGALVGGAPGGAPGHDGNPGANAEDGATEPGQPSLSGIGTFSKDGYAATNVGGKGSRGKPGQAGGGGGGGTMGWCGGDVCSYIFVGGGGGQGGHGGCGGEGGNGGGGGGASIALLVIDSGVTLSWSTLASSDGGRGGVPSNGGPGQPGGEPGVGGQGTNCGSAARTEGNAGAGGHGGRGGVGGPGGAGGGGPSIGLLSSGSSPVLSNVSFQTGVGGKGASGLAGRGADGESHDQLILDAGDGGAPAADARTDH